MADRPRKPLFPNPFYVVLLVASTLFVVTALAYLVSPYVGVDANGVRQAAKPGAALARAGGLARSHGPLALGVEFVVMLAFGLLAMATDHWFPSKASAKRPWILDGARRTTDGVSRTSSARWRSSAKRSSGHNRLYYVDAAPIISDREFDRLLKRLEELEAEAPRAPHPRQPHPARRRRSRSTSFATVTHAVPMLSIDNTYNYDEVREWDARIRKALNPGETVRYVVELKVDGVAVSLRYEEGRFVLGATRGDGERGDDVTANLRTVRDIPLILLDDPPPLLEVRGEVYMTNSELVRLNELRRAPRGGPVRQPAQLHGRLAQAARPQALRPAPAPLRLARPRRVSRDRRLLVHRDRRTASSAWGIPVSPHNATYDTIDEVIAHAERWSSQTEHARLPDRRPGHQGRRPRPAGAAGDAEQEPPLGDRVQVRGRAGGHARSSGSPSRSARPAS